MTGKEEQEGLCGEGGEERKEEGREGGERSQVGALNLILWKMHTRGWNANESWHVKATRQGSELSELTMEVFVTCSAEYVTKTSIFRPYYEFMPILPRSHQLPSLVFSLHTYTQTYILFKSFYVHTLEAAVHMLET